MALLTSTSPPFSFFLVIKTKESKTEAELLPPRPKMASKVVATAPKLLSVFFRHAPHRTYNGIPLATATRSFSTRSSPRKYSHRDGIIDTDSSPFLRAGELGPCRADKTKNDCYTMRVDVPGIPKERMILWAEKGQIYFSAKDSELPYYNYNGRVFGGSISFDPKKFDSGKVRFEVLNGVLWITVPRLKK